MPRKPSAAGRRAATTADAPTRRSQRATPKVQRWIDLLAALLRRRFAATFEEIAREVPAYSDTSRSESTRLRMFERDKDELRAFGIPIRSETSSDGETHGYRLDRREFYLPYLSVVAGGGRATPSRVERDFYRALGTLDFTPDELAAIGQAAARARDIGDARLAGDAASALRKLSFDVPADLVRADDGTRVVTESRGVDAAVFDLLGQALRRRKRVRFDYLAMSTGETSRREVEPWGLFFLGGHWYLAAHDVSRGAVRNFRVSRMSAVERNGSEPQSRDYEVPSDFDLREHARARSSWELGHDRAMDAVVEFRRRTGAALAAARLGLPVDGGDVTDDEGPVRRRYLVRRRAEFARWLLALGGDAVPVEPPALVEEFRRLAEATLAVYDRVAEESPDE